MQAVATTAQPTETTSTRRKRRIPAWFALPALVLVGVAAALPLWPPAPRPASAPTTEFSADRAVALLGGIAAVAHPTGSAAQTGVREYLLDALRRRGFEPHVMTRVAATSSEDGLASVGTVTDIYARIPGRQPTGRVLLVAHYDSVPIGPGASDDGSNVAAILELARAVRAGPQPRNDIELLFTDGEEQGGLGAKAFVESGEAGDPQRVVVVNLEARGVSGPAVMFQMAGTGLVPAVRASSRVTTSLAVAVYRMLPNDTDLTVFDEAGMRGLNFAFMGGPANYHTAHDDIARVSRASVQDMGDAALGATRQLAGADLTAEGFDATYFSLFGALVSYPSWLVLPLAVLAAVAFVALLWQGRHRGLSPRGVGWAAGTFPLCLVAATVIGMGAWSALTLWRPDFGLLFGHVYHPGRYALGEAALLLVVLVAWYRWARRRSSPLDVCVGVLGWFSLLSLVCAVVVPGGAYLFTWPVLIGSAAIAAALRLPDTGSPWRGFAACAAAVPAMALLLPVAMLLVPVLGLSLTVAPLLLTALLGVAMLPVLEPMPARRALTAGMLAVAIVSAGAMGIGIARDAYDAAHPRPVSLGYALETDTSTATWVSDAGADQPTVGPLLTGGRIRLDDRIPSLGGVSVQTGPAPVVAGLTGPRTGATAVDERDGIRTVRVRIVAPADAYSVEVFADTTTHQILDATVDGASIAGGRRLPSAAGDWGWGLRYAAPQADGIDLWIRSRGDGPLRIRVVSTSAGLPAGAGAPTLPANLSWASWPSVAGQTFVVSTFRL